MKAINLIWIIPLVLLLGYLVGYVSGILNQDIQPIVADRMEEMAENILPKMLTQLKAELNETEYCQVLQEVECELRQEEKYVTASIKKESAPMVLIQ